MLENLDPPIFTRPAAQAVEKGIPIVALDTAPTDGSKVTFYVGNDNYELGGMLAEATVKKLGKDAKGTVVVGVPNPGRPSSTAGPRGSRTRSRSWRPASASSARSRPTATRRRTTAPGSRR